MKNFMLASSSIMTDVGIKNMITFGPGLQSRKVRL